MGGGVRVHALPFDRAPELLDEGIVGGVDLAVATALAAVRQQGLLRGLTGKLIPWLESKINGAGCGATEALKALRQMPTSSMFLSSQLST